jgi:hypothetical protein
MDSWKPQCAISSLMRWRIGVTESGSETLRFADLHRVELHFDRQLSERRYTHTNLAIPQHPQVVIHCTDLFTIDHQGDGAPLANQV